MRVAEFVAQYDINGGCAQTKKRRKSNEMSDFGVLRQGIADTLEAEGTGLEPATPYGALHFQ